MVGAMGTGLAAPNVVSQESCSWKSLLCSQFDSPAIENKYTRSYLKKIYPSSHRLLVIVLLSHALLNCIQIGVFESLRDSSSLLQLSLLAVSACLNLCSLLFIGRLHTRLLSNLVSLLCLCPLALLSGLYPSACHIYLFVILVYTLASLPLVLSLLLSLGLTVVVASWSLRLDVRLIVLLLSNVIGIYVHRLLEIITRSAFEQSCQSKSSGWSRPTLVLSARVSLQMRTCAAR
jgi:hypothetical protein